MSNLLIRKETCMLFLTNDTNFLKIIINEYHETKNKVEDTFSIKILG